MTKAKLAVVRAAHQWWLGKRPVIWDSVLHVCNPSVNCISEREDALAIAVGRLAAQRKKGKRK